MDLFTSLKFARISSSSLDGGVFALLARLASESSRKNLHFLSLAALKNSLKGLLQPYDTLEAVFNLLQLVVIELWF